MSDWIDSACEMYYPDMEKGGEVDFGHNIADAKMYRDYIDQEEAYSHFSEKVDKARNFIKDSNKRGYNSEKIFDNQWGKGRLLLKYFPQLKKLKVKGGFNVSLEKSSTQTNSCRVGKIFKSQFELAREIAKGNKLENKF